MRIRRLWTTSAFLSLAFPLAAAASGDFFTAVRAALDEGRIGREEAFADLFRYAFEPGALPAGLAEGETLPLKCLTPSIAAFEEVRRSLDPALVAEIETSLGAARAPGKRTTLPSDSPGGNSTRTHDTSGPNAPPPQAADPATGVAAHAHWVAGYCDSSWNREIDGLGFHPPALNAGERYQIYFQNMGAYGYTMSTGGGRSYIVIENDFVGFPANQDPDGNQKGAAKATVAHEFKHASQMNTTGAMAMGGWVELDATWMEDVVYDSTNDYYNYLGSGSGISEQDQ